MCYRRRVRRSKFGTQRKFICSQVDLTDVSSGLLSDKHHRTVRNVQASKASLALGGPEAVLHAWRPVGRPACAPGAPSGGHLGRQEARPKAVLVAVWKPVGTSGAPGGSSVQVCRAVGAGSGRFPRCAAVPPISLPGSRFEIVYDVARFLGSSARFRGSSARFLGSSARFLGSSAVPRLGFSVPRPGSSIPRPGSSVPRPGFSV